MSRSIRGCADREAIGLLERPAWDARSFGELPSFLTKEWTVPALPSYIIEPIWQQFSALIPERRTSHPLGCHRSHIPYRVLLEKLVQFWYSTAPTRRPSTGGALPPRCETDATSGWIDLGMMDALREMAFEAYDRFVRVELPDVVDCCHTKATKSSEETPTYQGIITPRDHHTFHL